MLESEPISPPRTPTAPEQQPAEARAGGRPLTQPRARRDSKLTMLLRESLGNVNCRTTMIAHISAAAGSYAETLSTIQIASRVLRMKKKKTKVGSWRVGEGCGSRSEKPAQLSPRPPGQERPSLRAPPSLPFGVIQPGP